MTAEVPEMVERVARKMAQLDKRDPDAHPESEYKSGDFIPDIAWPDDHKIWMTYAWKARSIIKIMREPTEAMTLVGRIVVNNLSPGAKLTLEGANYRAMIDAALAKPGT